MKNFFKTVCVFMLAMFVTLTVFAKPTTLTTKVFGNCGHCKQNIEKALSDVEGITSAKWNKKSKILTVEYDNEKVTEADIKNRVTAAGYDFEDQKASDEAYDKLSKCCKYRD